MANTGIITMTDTIMATATEDALPGAALYRLMAWLSPAYPVGGFSYSHGVEPAVESGLVHDRATLTDYVRTVLGRGAGRIDAALFAAAWRTRDDAELDALVELAAAWRGTAELSLETAQQGASFTLATTTVWPSTGLAALAARHDGRISYPVAVAVAAAEQGVPLRAALAAYLQAFAANLVSAGVRLIPLGQTDGLRCLAALETDFEAATQAGLDADLATTGAAAPLVDWLSMRHETQYTRLFRS